MTEASQRKKSSIISERRKTSRGKERVHNILRHLFLASFSSYILTLSLTSNRFALSCMLHLTTFPLLVFTSLLIGFSATCPYTFSSPFTPSTITVKESLRLYPASPQINFLAATEDCTLSTGYHIPADTQLIVNIWKIHRDEHTWPDPHSFQPERFLSSHKDIDVRGQNYELLPFGSGRRSCPGLSLALQMMHLTLAALLHSFEMFTPSNEPADMTMSTGLTNMKATPLEVLLVSRFKF